MIPTYVTQGIVPSIALCITSIMWLSPLSAILEARRTREMGSLNPFPFVATIFNCVGWTIYACQVKDQFIFWSNITGTALGLYYILNCLTIMAKKSANESFSERYILVESLVIFAFFFWSLMGLVAATAFNSFPASQQQPAVFIGTLCMVLSIAYYAAPLSTMVEVCKTRDSSSLYPPLIFTNFINGFFWFCYGLAIQDINVAVPNGIGAALAIVQLSVRGMIPAREGASAAPPLKVWGKEISFRKLFGRKQQAEELRQEQFIDEKYPGYYGNGDAENPMYGQY